MADYNPLSAETWQGRVSSCRQIRREMLRTWQDNIDYRRGKPFRVAPSDDIVSVPADWTRSKTKAAKLYYQVPEFVLKARRPEFASATQVFGKALNFVLTRKVRLEHTMNECLSDVINAAGIAICKIGYEANFENLEQDPTAQPGMEPAERPAYECYYATRVSPAHFLWPVEWIGTDWDKCPWLGWESYMPLVEAQRLGWVDEDFEGTGINETDWWLVRDYREQQKISDKYVKFSEIFYHASTYDVQERDPRKIRRIVLIDGLKGEDAKVVDEDLTWQRYVPATPPQPPTPEQPQGVPGKAACWIGLTSYPIKVLTLTNISDVTIPPSDSEMGRPQVKELIRGRSQMIRQREHNVPLRWFDVNAVDEEIADRLRRGKWQDMIPMNGPGDRAFGEVARANFPRETFTFDDVAKRDLDEAWSMGGPQTGVVSGGDASTTATEVKTATSSLNERLDYERSWVLRFVLEIAEGIGSLMQLFADQEDYVEIIGPDGFAALQAWNRDTIAGEYIFEAKPDSQLRIDVQQRRTEALNMYKLLRRDPQINPQGLLIQLLELHGLDPAKSLAKPEPPKPPEPKISYAFKGEDMLNPIAVAKMQQVGPPLDPAMIQKAAELINAAVQAAAQPITPPAAPPASGAPPAAPGQKPPHPGPAPVVEPINQRYNQGMENPAESQEK